MILFAVALALALLLGPAPAAAQGAFVNFESGHVRPLALSPDGSRLFAVNTPDNRLAIYTVSAGGLTLAAEVPVGLEPVAVAARTDTEAWVVNHLSDSISIVTVDTGNPSLSRVSRTLHTCDEPRDIVFGGSAGTRAFVTAARRGQNCLLPGGTPLSPSLTTEGVGRTVVQVFDAGSLGAALGGTPISTLVLFGDTPRALAASPDGTLVYAAVFHSGNRTTTLNASVVQAGGGLPEVPGATDGAPEVGLIVRFDTAVGQWRDELDRNWNAGVAFSLPDEDVFIIDADANPPALASAPNSVTGVGTILFDMATRPGSGKLFVSNTEAFNEVRFEPEVNGHLHESHITVVDPATATASPRHLNPHIDYGVVPGPAGESAATLAFPTGMAFSGDGSQLFVAGFGSGKVGVFDADDLESGIVTKSLVAVGAGAANGGPTGLVFDAARDRLYVMNRFDHAISIVGNATQPSRAQTAVVPLRYDPSPAAARVGRRFLYDAAFTSSHGDSACASCHVFGDFDSLAWDLGDPFGVVEPNPVPFRLDTNPGQPKTFHPMKGPMTTQSLRGMAPAGAMHWRGDRNNPADPFDEDGAFKKFNPAFVGLLGRSAQLTAAEMQAFTDFILTVAYPPNPIKALTNADSAAEGAGRTFFNNTGVDGGVLTCEFCHRNPLGTDGRMSFEGESQEFKIAHLRNMYQKVGMFGVPANTQGIPATGNLGPQVRGFGFLHDGSVATVFDFLQADVFAFSSNTQRRNLEAFALAFDTGLRPAVGQQVSATPGTFGDAGVIARIDLLIARDDAGDCDLVVKGNFGGQARGAVYVGANNFQPDRNADAVVGKTALRNLAATAGQEQVYTCVPPGSGTRIGVDRDEDGFFDRTELDAGSDPANPASIPGATTTTTTTPSTTTTGPTSTTTSPATTSTTGTAPPTTSTSVTTTTTTGGSSTTTTSLPLNATRIQTTAMSLRDDSAPPISTTARKLSFKSSTRLDPPANRITPPARGGGGDPTQHGAQLVVYNSDGTSEQATVPLPSGLWTALGTPQSPKGYRYKSADSTAAVRKVVVKADKIVVRGGGPNLGYTLNEASQGSVALRLHLGTAAWCAEAGRPPYPPRTDIQDRFVAQPRTPAPATCP